ncbi:MAG: hypothetical protein BMS9Abin23_0902 [Thermodesulfobacteriota bacterium]|nr:MAG: hypothetical protein BMS9Abin23_0902 [Thermodesulfobacteriota bacterium]
MRTTLKVSCFSWTYAKNLSFIIASALLLIYGSAAVAQAAVLRVPGEYKKIQAAVDAASPGDVIIVAGGAYLENILIKKPLSIRSSGGVDETVIEAADKTKATVTVEGTSGVSLVGFTFKGSESAGLRIFNSKGVRVINIKAVESENGAVLISSTETQIFNSNMDYNTSFGLYLERSQYNNIRENTMSYNGDKGLFLSYSSNNTISGNSVNLNSWNGILLWFSNDNNINNNRTLRNTYGLVIGESSGNILTDNVTLPNIFIIMPVLLIYTGVLVYLIQKYTVTLLYGD